MNTSKENNERQPVGQFRPSFRFYHANPKGTGSAVKMNLHPAHDDEDGCIMLTIANQKTVGNTLILQVSDFFHNCTNLIFGYNLRLYMYATETAKFASFLPHIKNGVFYHFDRI